MASDTSPEHLLDVFRTAALSVTKLYKSSIDAQRKARAEGYQDCLDELLQFLDKEDLGLNDGEGWKIRAWANERLEHRDGSPQQEAMESDDDSEKQDAVSSPEIHRSNSNASLPQVPNPQVPQHTHLETIVQEPQPGASKSSPGEDIVVDEPEAVVVPSRDTFDFQSSIVYPQPDAHNGLNLASLHLSDSNRPPDHTTSHASSTPTPRKTIRRGKPGRPGRGPGHGSTHFGTRTGSKRHLEFNEFFDLANVKEFGPPTKRRHL
ncbi:unnamed protein product [Discula destructiva]